MPGKWCPIAPKAPTNRKISCALQRACAAEKIGMSKTGVPTKRRRSRQRSRIQGEGLVAAACWGAMVGPPAVDLVGANVCVDISRLIIQTGNENKFALQKG